MVVYSTYNGNYNRNVYIKAHALLPSFQFDRWFDAEMFNIKLQSAFVKNEDRDVMLKVVGNIEEESVQSVGDDGVSQSVVAKTGVATVGNVLVPNPVVLAPYRTFVEIQQPESDFIFRMQQGSSCALFEADGGVWKLTAMQADQRIFAIGIRKGIRNKEISDYCVMKGRKRQRKWFLLLRYEEERAVYLYEPLRKYEVQSRLKHGWREVR